MKRSTYCWVSLVLAAVCLGAASCTAEPGSPPGGGVVIGDRLPEISGTDADGRAFKLSDYRGKVVLVDFWGHW